MRERDMRLRVERFLQCRLRNMLMPATMGLGLALGGCASDALSADDGGDQKDVGAVTDTGPSTKYSAPTTDASVPPPVALYSVVMPKDAGAELRDSGMVLRYQAVIPDAAPDLDDSVAIYMAPMSDPSRAS